MFNGVFGPYNALFTTLHLRYRPQTQRTSNPTQAWLDNYLAFGEQLNNLTWRPQKPGRIFEAVEGLLETGTRRIY